ARKQTSKFERGLNRAVPIAKKTALAIGSIGAASVREAAKLKETSGAVQVAFGDQAAAVRKYGKQAAQTAGLARSEYQEMASRIGSVLDGIGIKHSELAATTDMLITRGADLADVTGVDQKTATEALTRAMRGRTRRLEQLGVVIDEAKVKEKVQAQGLDDTQSAEYRAAEAAAIRAQIMEKTADIQGNYANNTEDMSVKLDKAKAKIKNAAAAMGIALLPTIERLAGSLERLAGWIEEHNRLFTILLGTLGLAAGSILAVKGALATYQAVTVIAAGATRGLGAALAFLAANPVVAIVAGVALLAYTLVRAYRESETFRRIVNTSFGKVIKLARQVGGFVRSIASGLGSVTPHAALVGGIMVNASTAPQSAIQAMLDLIERLIQLAKDAAKYMRELPAILRNAGSMIPGFGWLTGEHARLTSTAHALRPAHVVPPGSLQA